MSYYKAARQEFAQGYAMRHHSPSHLNSKFPFDQLDLGKYLNDAAALMGGVPVGGLYKLTAANPYGMREGTVVERLV
jgi:hypothetical protein